MQSMKNSGLDCRLKTPFSGVKKNQNGGFNVELEDGSNIQTSLVLAAIGRKPNLENLKLDNAGV